MSAPPTPGGNGGKTKGETSPAPLSAEPPVVTREGAGSEIGDGGGGRGGNEGGGGISGGSGDEATAVATVDAANPNRGVCMGGNEGGGGISGGSDAADPNDATIHSGSLSNLETRGSGLLRHCVVEPFLLPTPPGLLKGVVSLAHTSRGARNLLEASANAIVKETPGYADVHSQQLISR